MAGSAKRLPGRRNLRGQPDGTPSPAWPRRGGALGDAAPADGIALVRCGQGWTGPLGPRSRRIDCMIANVVVLV